jgi:hypothetical protein
MPSKGLDSLERGRLGGIGWSAADAAGAITAELLYTTSGRRFGAYGLRRQ